MNSIIKKILILLPLLALTACSNYGAPDYHNQESVSEYVNRIAKKIIIVSDQSSINYQFSVNDNPIPEISFDQEDNKIIVSSGLLQNLSDEAELAAILSLAMAKYAGLADPDQATINYLYRAGYDPRALIDIQEQGLYANLYATPVTASTIEYNKHRIASLPKGLLRESVNFCNHIQGSRCAEAAESATE